MKPQRALDRIDAQFAAIRTLIVEHPEALDLGEPEVSGWSVRLQVDHILKALSIGLQTLDGGIQKPQRPIKPLGRLLMALDWLPRGVAKSPERIAPVATSDAGLVAELDRLAAAYRALDPADERLASPAPVFPHPYFGGLSACQGIAFLGTHTHHHWKIVRDIRRASARRSKASAAR
ncbi:MAG: DinB family protein [Thermoanaerobaculia bacterium]